MWKIDKMKPSLLRGLIFVIRCLAISYNNLIQPRGLNQVRSSGIDSICRNLISVTAQVIECRSLSCCVNKMCSGVPVSTEWNYSSVLARHRALG